MSTVSADGSPGVHKRQLNQFTILDEGESKQKASLPTRQALAVSHRLIKSSSQLTICIRLLSTASPQVMVQLR